jgi:hypothetical protein
MPSKRQIHTTLSKEDFELFQLALQLSKEKTADLLREIVKSWICLNRLSLIKNGKSKRTKK